MKRKILSVLLLTMSMFAIYTPNVHAQNVICDDIFPFLKNVSFLSDSLCTGETTGAQSAVDTTAGLVQFGLSLVFVGIIVVSIYIIIKAALKYIRSEGDADKIQEAQKAIKSVFIGIAALFIGIIGIVIVIAFFNATGGLNNDNVDQPSDPGFGIDLPI